MNEFTINQADLDWEPAASYRDGTQWKVLRRGAEGEAKAVLLKLPRSFEMEAHSHVNAEHHYVLEGQVESEGRPFPAGSYRLIPAHANHGPFQSADGALVLVIWEG